MGLPDAGEKVAPGLLRLIAKLKANPGLVSWAGGPIGGFDHVLVSTGRDGRNGSKWVFRELR
jgi:hypothetical protein